MEILSGLSVPKVPSNLQDKNTVQFFSVLCKFLEDVLLKMKQAVGATNSSVTVVTDVRVDSGNLQKKSRVLNIRGGVVESIGTESSWTNAGAV